MKRKENMAQTSLAAVQSPVSPTGTVVMSPRSIPAAITTMMKDVRVQKAVEEILRTDKKEVMRALDLFGYTPSYTYQPYRSSFGGWMSIVTLTLMFYYGIKSIISWWAMLPALQLESYRVLQADYSTVPREFAVRLRRTSDNSFWYNTTYVSVTFKHVTITNGGAKKSVTLGTSQCDTALGLALCPTNLGKDYEIQGRYTDNTYKYIDVAVNRCSGSCGGLSSSAIMSYLADNVDLVFIRNRWQFKTGTYFKIEAPWRRRKIRSVDRWLGNLQTPETLLTFDTYYTVLADLTSTYFKFYVRLDATETIERITPPTTLLDECGRIASVFSFLTALTLGVWAVYYNKRMFRHRFNDVLEAAGVPPPARDLRLFDINHFNKWGELDPSILERAGSNPQTAMDNLRHMALQSTKAHDTRKRYLKSVVDYNEPLQSRRKTLQAFVRWWENCHPGEMWVPRGGGGDGKDKGRGSGDKDRKGSVLLAMLANVGSFTEKRPHSSDGASPHAHLHTDTDTHAHTDASQRAHVHTADGRPPRPADPPRRGSLKDMFRLGGGNGNNRRTSATVAPLAPGGADSASALVGGVSGGGGGGVESRQGGGDAELWPQQHGLRQETAEGRRHPVAVVADHGVEGEGGVKAGDAVGGVEGHVTPTTNPLWSSASTDDDHRPPQQTPTQTGEDA